ncbi:FkbM family methyltransferase [Tabrizicola sp.]|uniref:FkbM family methyltransferase n=1 Tax=Tabrizicola sp. TaxID=2005166 RepID=UPI003F3E3394
MQDPKAPAELQLLLDELKPSRITTIVDVGANPINEPPYHLLRQLNACHVVNFEPEAKAFAALQAAKRPNETNYNHAVGDGQTRELHLYRDEPMTSIFRPYMPGLTAVCRAKLGTIRGTEMMETVALDRVVGLPQFDMMKIDAQGAEKLAFIGAQRMLQSAVAVIVELRYQRLYQDEPMLGETDVELSRQGFCLHKFLFNKTGTLLHSQLGRVRRKIMGDQLIDGDAVYLRNIAEPEHLSEDQLMHLAILGSGVIQSHSLALYCLDELVRRGTVPTDMPARYVDALPASLRRD